MLLYMWQTWKWFWFICVTSRLSDHCSLSLSLSMCSWCLSPSGPDSFCQSHSRLLKDKLECKPTSFFSTHPETLPVLSKQQKKKQLQLLALANTSRPHTVPGSGPGPGPDQLLDLDLDFTLHCTNLNQVLIPWLALFLLILRLGIYFIATYCWFWPDWSWT